MNKTYENILDDIQCNRALSNRRVDFIMLLNREDVRNIIELLVQQQQTHVDNKVVKVTATTMTLPHIS
jgi:hypothetical protein